MTIESGRRISKLVLPGAILGMIAVMVLGLVSAVAAMADDGVAGSVRALRLTGVDGQVQVTQDGQVIADPAYDNLPLFEGSQITTGNDGRAEVQLEDGSIARLSPNTTMTFSVLTRQGDGTRTEVVLNHGLGYFELQPSNAQHSLRVNYGSSSFASDSFSVIRVNADHAPGLVAVFSGNIRLERGGSLQLDLHGGESLSLDATSMSGYHLTEGIEPDSWDSWNADRDQLMTTAAAEKTEASSEFINMNSAVSDLNTSGNWYNLPGNGYVWSPYEAQQGGAGWDPYGYGRWAYYPGRGYLWVSGYDWGYAPYQCGLWNFYDGLGWGWEPGGAYGCNNLYGDNYGGYGGGGWAPNIGSNVPLGFHPPHRPSPPRGPNGPHRVQPETVAVDHRSVRESAAPRDLRGRVMGAPVTIAGREVEPLRPVVARPVYERGPQGVGSRGGTQSGYLFGAPPAGFGGGNRTAIGGHPAYPGGNMGPGHSSPGSFNSGAGRVSSGGYSGGSSRAASAPSGGGSSGGGGGHVSAPSGGGGGGGGGVHK